MDFGSAASEEFIREANKLFNEDGIEGMKRLQDGCIDLILCDLPYGTTTCKWDVIIPFKDLWDQYERIIKPNGAIVLFSAQPFTSKLVMSNLKMFRYEIIWEKGHATNFANAKKMPMKSHENILVFYKKLPTYNPQGLKDCRVVEKNNYKKKDGTQAASFSKDSYVKTKTGYPKSVWKFKRDSKSFHPTQKPVDLVSELIKSYSNKGDIVLDNCMGSGTTAVSCIREKRNYIGFELDSKFYGQAQERIIEELVVINQLNKDIPKQA